MSLLLLFAGADAGGAPEPEPEGGFIGRRARRLRPQPLVIPPVTRVLDEDEAEDYFTLFF